MKNKRNRNRNKEKIITFILLILILSTSCGYEIKYNKNKPQSDDWGKQEYLVPGCPFNATEMEQVNKIARNIGTKPEFLLILLKHESNFNTRAKNPRSGAVGLLQWMPITLTNWDLLSYQVLDMTVTQQLVLVQQYYNMYDTYDLSSVDKLYLCCFYPYGLKQYNNNTYIFGSEIGTTRAIKIAHQNDLFDLNKDGLITMFEFKTYYSDYIKQFKI